MGQLRIMKITTAGIKLFPQREVAGFEKNTTKGEKSVLCAHAAMF